MAWYWIVLIIWVGLDLFLFSGIVLIYIIHELLFTKKEETNLTENATIL